ncbi:hypothetical protein EB118_26415 [bacterium]|nr:hypothetical protein [bacterium]
MTNLIQTWRFLYTSFPTVKQATTKTSALKEGKNSRSHYIVTSGLGYSDCLNKAIKECKFNEKQLIGVRQIL